MYICIWHLPPPPPKKSVWTTLWKIMSLNVCVFIIDHCCNSTQDTLDLLPISSDYCCISSKIPIDMYLDWRHKPGVLCLHLWEKVKLCCVNTFVMIDSDFWSFDQKDLLECSRFCMMQHWQLIYFLNKLIHRRFFLTSDFVSEHQIFTYKVAFIQ